VGPSLEDLWPWAVKQFNRGANMIRPGSSNSFDFRVVRVFRGLNCIKWT
jgi:hypothetical protein